MFLALALADTYKLMAGIGAVSLLGGYAIGVSLAQPPNNNYHYMIFGETELKHGGKEGSTHTVPGDTDASGNRVAIDGNPITPAQAARFSTAFHEWKNSWGQLWKSVRLFRIWQEKYRYGTMEEFIKFVEDNKSPALLATPMYPHPGPGIDGDGDPIPVPNDPDEPPVPSPYTPPTVPGVPHVPPNTPPQNPPRPTPSPTVPTSPKGPSQPNPPPRPSPSQATIPDPKAKPPELPKPAKTPLESISLTFSLGVADANKHARLAQRIENAWNKYKDRYKTKVGGSNGKISLTPFWGNYWHRTPGATFEGFATYLENMASPDPYL